MEPVTIEPLWVDLADQRVESWCGGVWSIKDLVDRASELPVFDLPLTCLDLTNLSFKCVDIVEFCRHGEKVVNADLRYPIIMDHKGCVLDGRHRIAKALMLGRVTIKAVRFSEHEIPTFRD